MTDSHAHTSTETQPTSKSPSNSPCKSTKRDGSPCQGRGLEQFDGYCIAHAPPHLTRAWRAKGGKNSSTAARQDKRVPEHLKVLLDDLTQGLHDVRAGTLAASDYNAMCRGISTYLEVQRHVQKDMERIHAEEVQTAAQEVAGVHGDIEILTAAAAINDQENEYRQRGLVDQGLATLEASSEPDQPAITVLTPEGKRRFGERRTTSYNQESIDLIRNALRSYKYNQNQLPGVLELVESMSEEFEAALTDLENLPEPPKDPFTGQPITEPPLGLKRDDQSDGPPVQDDRTPEILTDQYTQVKNLRREVDDMSQIEHYEAKQKYYQHELERDQATGTTNQQPPAADDSQVPNTGN